MHPGILGRRSGLAHWLNWRQDRCFEDLTEVWLTTRKLDTSPGGLTGAPGDETYQLLANGVRYLHDSTPNIDDPTTVGGILRPTLFTTDQGCFEVRQPVPDNALLVNRSLLPDGSRSPLYGRVYRVLGPDQSIPNQGIRTVNTAIYNCRIVEHPAKAFLALAGL